jgi:hypothetical protein
MFLSAHRYVLNGGRQKGKGISQSIKYRWLKGFMEAGKRLLDRGEARAAKTEEVKDLRCEAPDLKEVVAQQSAELRFLKQHDRRCRRPRMKLSASACGRSAD